MGFLEELIYRLIPVAIPIILIASFMVNHGLAPSGGNKKKEDNKEEKTEEKSKEKSKEVAKTEE